MSRWKSTLGQPLNAADEDHIIEAWEKLRDETLNVTLYANEHLDPVRMVEIVDAVILEAQAVRRAITGAWITANRAIGPRPKPHPVDQRLRNDLLELFGTEEKDT